jgi:hypothetical protein
MGKVPLVNQISWTAELLHLLMLGALVAGLWYLGDFSSFNDVLFLAFIVTIVHIMIGRRMIPLWHRRGVRLVMAGHFPDAITCFEKSYVFFTKYPWLDTMRYGVLLSSSKMPYREMALVNIAFAYGQLGEGATSKAYYERALTEFPGSILAQTSLNMIKAFESGNK